VLRRDRPGTKIILSEPADAPLVGSGVAQSRGDKNAPAGSHSAWKPHPIQGWTPDFIPYVLQEAIDSGYYDQVLAIPGPVAMDWSRKLAQREGIFTGVSGGATFAAAMQVASSAPSGSVVLCMLPDTGERYLSTPLFENIPADMTDDEKALSMSDAGLSHGAGLSIRNQPPRRSVVTQGMTRRGA
jgi:cysteine synthase A